MTALAVIGLILNTSIAIVAASRLIFAVARDGVLPGSSWIGQVTEDGRPRNAVTVMGVFGAVLLCTILPSNVAFTSLISAGAIREWQRPLFWKRRRRGPDFRYVHPATIAAYALIAFCRFVFTPNDFRHTRFGLGKFARPFYVIAFIWNGFIFAVS
jgi:amino acid transporter